MLSPHEREIMELLWSEGRALSRAEIIDLTPNKSWKPSTIHLLLNSLLKKDAIVVDGFVQTGRNYGRTFAAALTQEEFTAQVLLEGLPKQVNLVCVVSALLNNSQLTDDELDELQQILDERKRSKK